MKMSSGEERLEEMLKAVMDTEGTEVLDRGDSEMTGQETEALFPENPEISEDIPEEIEGDVLGDIPEEIGGDVLSDIPEEIGGDVLGDIPEEIEGDALSDIPKEIEGDVLGDIPEETEGNALSDIPEEIEGDVLGDIPEEMGGDISGDISNDISDGMMEDPGEIMGGVPDAVPELKSQEDAEMIVDPLTLLDMSEEEIDQVLEKEAGAGDAVPGREAASMQEKDLSDLLGEHEELSDFQDLFSMSENHESVVDLGMTEDFSFGDVDLDSESAQNILGLTADGENDFPEEPEEEAPPKTSEEKPEKEKKKKEKKGKKEKKQKPSKEGKEKKEGFGKKLARLFFGSDEDELDAEEGESGAVKEEQAEDKNNKANAKQEKKKKEKKKKPEKKKEPDPKKAAKEKQKKEKNAEKAKKKAEKAEKAEKERRAAKKLPKKKVIVWVLLCASIAAGILLMNSVGMKTLQLTEARDAFYDKDFGTAYELLNGEELTEEDQLIFQQSSVVLHLQHAESVYENHLELDKPVMALEDLLKGVGKYQELLENGREDLITPEAAAQYQNILTILQDKYGLSEESVMEINALDDDYAFSLQLEAIVNGEIYQSQSEIEQQEEEAAVTYPELEDMLPEEAEYLEEYLNDSGD